MYFREGNSDKVYQCAIEPAGDDRFSVTFAYGRRGTTLSTGTKTSSPVGYNDAKGIFDKLVKEKTSKGYTQGPGGTPYTGNNSDKQASGILPQLLNPIDEAEVERLLHDDDYCAQEKFDGRHLLVRKQGGQIDGINKKGLLVGMPETVFNDMSHLPGDSIPDGEAIGDVYHTFDLLELNGENLRTLAYRARLTALLNLLASAQHRFIKYVETAFTTKQKVALWERLKAENREGIVFKPIGCAPYTRSPQLRWHAVEAQVLRFLVGGGLQDQTPSGAWRSGCSARTAGRSLATSPFRRIIVSQPSARWSRCATCMGPMPASCISPCISACAMTWSRPIASSAS